MAVTATSIIIVMMVVVDVMQVVSSQRKPGACALNYRTNVCVKICQQDMDCSGLNKCCPTECGGTMCSRPITARPRENRVKPGSCPIRPDGPWVCSSRCTVDADCRGRLKCCKNRCGALACLKPQ